MPLFCIATIKNPMQNCFHDFKRNRLTSERSVKYQFIYINKHALQIFFSDTSTRAAKNFFVHQ